MKSKRERTLERKLALKKRFQDQYRKSNEELLLRLDKQNRRITELEKYLEYVVAVLMEMEE